MTATVTELKPPVKKRPQPLKRGSAYFLPGSDHPLVSVTTVLNEIAKQETIGRWKAKVAAEFAFANPEASLEEAVNEPDAVRDDAASRGKTIHSWVEAYIKGAPLDPEKVSDKFRGYATGFVAWVEAWKPEFLHSEVAVFNLDYEYAGTCDAIVRDHQGRTLLIDLKTNNYYDEWSFGLQASAYLHTDFILTGPDRQPIDLPPIDTTAIVHLKKDGGLLYRELPDHFHSFIAYLHIFRAKRGEPCVDACWCKGVTE